MCFVSLFLNTDLLLLVYVSKQCDSSGKCQYLIVGLPTHPTAYVKARAVLGSSQRESLLGNAQGRMWFDPSAHPWISSSVSFTLKAEGGQG